MLNGAQLTEDFEGTQDGVRYAKRVAMDAAKELASKVKRGYVIICVAGMRYAAAVESKGFDVITGSAIQAKEDLRAAFARITLKASKIPLK